MLRVHVICEGQTEETFVQRILAKELTRVGVALTPSIIGKPGHKGGNVKYQRLRTDVRNRLLGDPTSYCTTFFDFYGLPSDFPGKQQAATAPTTREKSACVIHSLSASLTNDLGEEAVRRFLPYVQMHEFEALLYSDPPRLAAAIQRLAIGSSIQAIRSQFSSPEEINDSPLTAPSKRLLRLYPAYDKPVSGTIAAESIGLETIRRECVLFNEWIKQLEHLPTKCG